MTKVYRIKPLHKKSICWHVEMYRENDNGTISWFNVDDHYRWGQGFIEEDMDCNLPLADDIQAHARTDSGWGSELDDQHACWFEYSDDIADDEKEAIESAYHEGGAGWLFDGEHEWQVEDDYLVIDAPFQVDLCDDDGTVIEENIKLRTREELIKSAEEWTKKNSNSWPFD